MVAGAALFKDLLLPWEQPWMIVGVGDGGKAGPGGQGLRGYLLSWWGQEPSWRWPAAGGHLLLCTEACWVVTAVAELSADTLSCDALLSEQNRRQVEAGGTLIGT